MSDVTNIKLLRKAYDEAVKLELDSFIFNGEEMHTNYVKYLLEHHSS